MSSKYWIISIPNQGQNPLKTAETLNSNTIVKGLSANFRFDIPVHEMKIGTLDSLMELTDDIDKLDTFVDSIIKKLERTLSDLVGKDSDDLGLIVDGHTPNQYLTNWTWAYERYTVNMPLKDITSKISSECSRIEDDLRARVSHLQESKNSLMALQRKEQGTLQNKSLAPIVKEIDIIEGEFLKTLMVVVPLSREEQFLNTYETMDSCEEKNDSVDSRYVKNEEESKDLKALPFAHCIVPRSAKRLASDSEFALYRVVVFRKGADSFKTNARHLMYTVREFTYDPDAVISAVEQMQQLELTRSSQHIELLQWCRSNFAEAFIAWIHLKAIRVFIESVLRYGLPLDFQAFTIRPKKGAESQLKAVFFQLYSHLSAGFPDTADINSAEGAMIGVAGEFYPYVFVPISITDSM